jgi:hypothetical protein
MPKSKRKFEYVTLCVFCGRNFGPLAKLIFTVTNWQNIVGQIFPKNFGKVLKFKFVKSLKWAQQPHLLVQDRYTLVGIVAGGVDCKNGYPSWYTKVAFFR